MAPTTADEWLPILTRNLDKRAESIQKARSYCNGNAPLPEMGKNLKASWEAFQKKARVNYGGLAVRALKNRIRPRGVVIGDGTNADAAAAAARIWRDNRMAAQFAAAIRDRLETRVGYLVVGLAAGAAVVTREKPEFFIASTDPLQPWKARAALKVWRDEDLGQDYAYVWIRGERQKYFRNSKDSSGVARTRAFGDDWEQSGDPEPYEGDPPIVVLERPDGQAFLEEHYDVIDAINHGKLQRLVTTAMQAFRQRALKRKTAEEDGGAEPDDKDADGNDVDYSKIFEPAPGALWDLPDGIDIWESQYTDITPMLAGEKADRRDFAAVTSTPLSALMPEGENQSAEGAANAKEGHIALAQDEIDDMAPGLAMAMVYALQAESVELAETDTVAIDFAPPALVSLQEQYAAAAAAKAAGLPLRTIMRTVLGMTHDQIKQAESDLADEQLNSLALGAGGGAGGGSGNAAA